MPRLEEVLGYKYNDKDSVKMWKQLNSISAIPDNLFPESLKLFFEFDNLDTSPGKPEVEGIVPVDSAWDDDDLPF